MPPTLALLGWLVLLLGLLFFDPAKEPETSAALWIPVIWMFIAGSRLPSQWLDIQGGTAVQVSEDGNPVDRTILAILIFLAIVVLLSRRFRWGNFLTQNIALVAFVLFALLSVFWSDFPDVCLKRWFRDLGNYFVILVVLSDPRPLHAVRTVLRRLFYLLVPLSIVLIKYFPDIGRGFDTWTGAGTFVGVTTSKNLLGLVALISGLFFLWDFVTRWPNRKAGIEKKIIMLDAAFIAMTFWLLSDSNSA
ncbi:MAG: hypothetical protein WBF35_09925, partial [Candidatus Acidiferrales bacterium]